MSKNENNPAAFDLLERGIQKKLYSMGWRDLRPVQESAIQKILQTSNHIIISASTAAGKTEAAFLPILSHLASEPKDGIQAVYVGPLRALINDQFRRVEDLCGYLELPVHRWHGDVSGSKKNSLLKDPRGVLLITPESIESLFVNQSSNLSRLFGNLGFVVIDEMHAFLGADRGRHLQSLLNRLEAHAIKGGPSAPLRRIGLSATIGDFDVAKRFLDLDQADQVVLLTEPAGEKEIRFKIHAYEVDDAPSQELARDVVAHCGQGSNLIFGEGKKDVEVYADLATRLSEEMGSTSRFFVHHGSLSREVRDEAEEAMRSERPSTVFCSSTLEMGIDVGNVRLVGQIGAPHGVASLKQRLGRSGRKDGEPSRIRIYIPCRKPGKSLFDGLHLDLVQSVAITELMKEGWVEPTPESRCDLSTVAHQIISVICETGGASAKHLHECLCKKGPFREIEVDLFGSLLRSLAGEKIIEQMEGGDLILSEAGEKIRSRLDFYGVFQTRPEYSVRSGSRTLGSLPIVGVPRIGDVFLLAGKRWQVKEVHSERGVLEVGPALTGKAPVFLGSSGDVHPKVIHAMKGVLLGKEQHSYLDERAGNLLAKARSRAIERGICGDPFVEAGEGKTAWMTWTGTRIQETLRAILRASGLSCSDNKIALTISLPVEKARAAVAAARDQEHDPGVIAASVRPKARRKFDSLLSEDLLETAISRDILDLPGASRLLDEA